MRRSPWRRTMASSSRCPLRPRANSSPGLSTPTQFRAIVNAHYRIEPPAGLAPMIGVVHGLAQWLFAFPGRLSVTISAADHLLEIPREELAARIWRDVAAVADIAAPMPAWQIVRERRATFAASPGAGGEAPRRGHRLDQSVSGRRLDQHRPSGDDRGRHPIRNESGAYTRAAMINGERKDVRSLSARHSDFAEIAGRRDRRSDRRPARRPASGRALGVRARGRRHHPRRICPDAALPRASPSTRNWRPRAGVQPRARAMACPCARSWMPWRASAESTSPPTSRPAALAIRIASSRPASAARDLDWATGTRSTRWSALGGKPAARRADAAPVQDAASAVLARTTSVVGTV